MAKQRTATTKLSIERRIKEGRGKGFLSNYKPWLTIHDVPSKGIATRVLGWKTNRLHHFFSEHFELAHFYEMEWAPEVLDLREQFPLLPLDKTLYIAQKLGVKHPVDPKTGHPIVMTTDQLITIKNNDDVRFEAHAIKPKSKLKKRVLEKLEIERVFFKDLNISWELITEEKINYHVVKNMIWIHSSKTLDGLPDITIDVINDIQDELFEALQNKSKPCAKVTLEQDLKHKLPQGSCMNILKYLVANRVWWVDMNSTLQPLLQPIQISKKYEREPE